MRVLWPLLLLLLASVLLLVLLLELLGVGAVGEEEVRTVGGTAGGDASACVFA